MGSDRIRVDRIPGGVWPGAQVKCDECGHSMTGWNLECTFCGSFELSLWLSDELGLGLAGLAGRVARRLGVEVDDPWEFDASSDDRRIRGVYAQFSGFDESDPIYGSNYEWPALRDLPAHVLVTISSGIALTDRLCAAVGLAREGHEVAVWEYTVEEGWLLSASSSPPMPVTSANYTDAWLPALEAALDAVEER